MTRDAVLKRITRKMRHLEGCRFNYSVANEILTLVESCEPTLKNSWEFKRKKSKKKK